MLLRPDILRILEEKDIKYREFTHEAVFTIDEAESLSIPGFDMSRVPKNLFLRDDKKREYYLLSIAPDEKADLKELRKRIGSRPLSFASEDDLGNLLQLEKGSVTPFGLLADSERRVTAIFSSYFQDGEIGIHPMVNTSTVFLAYTDLLSLIQEHGNKIVII